MVKESEQLRMGNSSHEEIKSIALEELRMQHSGHFSESGIYAGTPESVKYLNSRGAYYLVPIYNDIGLCGIVQIEEQKLKPESSAVIQDPKSEFLISTEDALSAAKSIFPTRQVLGKPFLAWKPCRESFNSMYPFWVINYTDGEIYVTQNKEVFEILTSGFGG